MNKIRRQLITIVALFALYCLSALIIALATGISILVVAGVTVLLAVITASVIATMIWIFADVDDAHTTMSNGKRYGESEKIDPSHEGLDNLPGLADRAHAAREIP